MAQNIVGVDIGSASVRAVEVRGGDGARPQVVRRAEIPLPETATRRGEVVEVGTVATALKRLWTTGGFKSKQIAMGVGGQAVFAREFSVQRASLPQIRESLPFQVQDLLPVPVGEVLLDYYPIAEEPAGENGPMVSGLLVAAVKEVVNTNVGAAMSAGLRPVHVDLVPFALSRAIAPVRSARGRDVIIEIGANTTNVVVVSDGVPVFVRMIPSGGDEITRMIATRLQWAPRDAEAAKRAIGMGGMNARQEDRPVLEIIYEVVGEQLAGIRSTLSYYASARPSAPVQRVLLSGGGSQLIGLPNALAELVGLPVGIVDPFANVSVGRGPRNGAGDAAFAAALGLSLGSHE